MPDVVETALSMTIASIIFWPDINIRKELAANDIAKIDVITPGSTASYQIYNYLKIKDVLTCLVEFVFVVL